MAGIYIHIPFCRQACHYCNFHFSTSLNNKDQFILSLLKEIEMQKDYLVLEDGTRPVIESVYFGGGTPSLLDADEILKILDAVAQHHVISNDAEITLEANPDDLTTEKIRSLKNTPVNRLSIGIQSFVEEDLKFMNRAHSAAEGYRSIVEAQAAGFHNLSADLIYGTPTLSDANWEQNMETAMSLNIPHLSCYCLTVEDKTALAGFVKSRKVADVDEDKSVLQFQMLLDKIASKGYEQYEISNFCRDGMYSRHNSNYWLKENYLGLGPSSHSYNNRSRQWNIANNARYIESIANNKIPFEMEVLTVEERFNEYILTSLRTKWGTNLDRIRKEFGEHFYNEVKQNSAPYILNAQLMENKGSLFLTDAGKLLADQISADLFII